ncbi:MAG: acyl-CoA dehydrogenase family protein [Rhodobacteraceae bacterium]|nr:acyl-CoA dehydrogenase family protein [Paracoccaceae bacterium]
MTKAAPRTRLTTHEVRNQPPDFGDRNLYLDDVALREAVRREAGDWLDATLTGLGALAGSAEVLALGDDANRNPPTPRIFDRGGARLDEVSFHPAYHRLMDLAMSAGIHDIAWKDGAEAPPRAPHAGHAAMLAVFTQAEAGVMCPVNMTYAAVPVLRADPASAEWAARIVGGRYDPDLRPIGSKAGLTVGMAMTEKQGGSDVRANSTRAEPDGSMYRLTGHKWFCSAPMSDGVLTLAQTDAGLSCFLVPRVLPDGDRNAIALMRLKDKLGNRSNASAEIEYHGALAWPLGASGDGVRTIITMVHHTRLGTIAATLGIMRRALAETLHRTAHRHAFGKALIDQPAMQTVLADLQVEYEAAAALVMHVAARFGAPDPETRAYSRLAVALAKYILTKRCPAFVAECLECHGGDGYVEDGPLARYYREAPLNGIWEGSGNVIALDILRTLARAPEAADVLLGLLADTDAELAGGMRDLVANSTEGSARHMAEALALRLQAALLIRDAPAPVSDAFRGRLAGALTYGARFPISHVKVVVERARLT